MNLKAFTDTRTVSGRPGHCTFCEKVPQKLKQEIHQAIVERSVTRRIVSDYLKQEHKVDITYGQVKYHIEAGHVEGYVP